MEEPKLDDRTDSGSSISVKLLCESSSKSTEMYPGCGSCCCRAPRRDRWIRPLRLRTTTRRVVYQSFFSRIL